MHGILGMLILLPLYKIEQKPAYKEGNQNYLSPGCRALLGDAGGFCNSVVISATYCNLPHHRTSSLEFQLGFYRLWVGSMIWGYWVLNHVCIIQGRKQNYHWAPNCVGNCVLARFVCQLDTSWVITEEGASLEEMPLWDPALRHCLNRWWVDNGPAHYGWCHPGLVVLVP